MATQTLRDVSLVAEPGEVLCLLGPSGSGKTTLLRIAAGIEPQTTGRVLLNDREIAGPSRLPAAGEALDRAGLPGFRAVSAHDDPRQCALRPDGAVARGGPRRGDGGAAPRRAGKPYAASYPHVLSGGEQQRVALARALAPRPAVLLMDEPFSGLDTRLKDSVRAETLAILRESRATAIVVTHDAEEAMRMGDRIALLKDGQLVQTGGAEDLYLRPTTLFAAGFFSELNVFGGKVKDGRVETPLGRVEASGWGEGAEVQVAVRCTGFDVSETEGQTQARLLSQALSRRRRTAGTRGFGRRRTGARAGQMRRFVEPCARHLAFTAYV